MPRRCRAARGDFTTEEPLMAMAIYAKKIHCPNCHYEGKARVLGSGCGLWLTWLAVLTAAIAFSWLIIPPIICILMFLWLLFKPAKQTCRICGNPNVIPVRQWREAHQKMA
jgi:hypothetical protein